MWIEAKLSNLHRISAVANRNNFSVLSINRTAFIYLFIIRFCNVTHRGTIDELTIPPSLRATGLRFRSLSNVHVHARAPSINYWHSSVCVRMSVLVVKISSKVALPFFFFFFLSANNFISPDRTEIQFSLEYMFHGFSFISKRGRWYVRIENVFWKIHWQERIKGDAEARGETLPEENQ